MNYQKITKFDVANGPGIRTTLWVSGCDHHCKGCHNSITWDMNSGTPVTDATLCEILDSLDSPHIRGLTFSGGDPLMKENRGIVTKLAQIVKFVYPEKDIWMWTGFLYESVKVLKVMDYIDVLVDGPFILEQRDITLKYRGSPNQRVIDVKKSKELDSIILYEEDI